MTPSVTAQFRRAEVAEKLAKRHGPGGGIHVWTEGDPDQVDRIPEE